MDSYLDAFQNEELDAPRRRSVSPKGRSSVHSSTVKGLRGFGRKSSKASSGSKGAKPNAIVKAKWRRGSAASGKSKGHIRYLLTRENEQGEALMREGFDADKNGLTRKEMAENVDENSSRQTYQYRFILAPDADKDGSGIDLQEYARGVMNQVERSLEQDTHWVGVVHSGEGAHTEHGHIHILAMIDHELERPDLDHFRAIAGQEFTQSLKQSLGLQHDDTFRFEFHQHKQDFGGTIDEMVASDAYFDTKDQGGTGLVTHQTLEHHYRDMQQNHPDVFKGDTFDKHAFDDKVKKLTSQVGVEAGDLDEARNRYLTGNGGTFKEVVEAKEKLSKLDDGEGKSRAEIVEEMTQATTRGGRMSVDMTDGGNADQKRLDQGLSL